MVEKKTRSQRGHLTRDLICQTSLEMIHKDGLASFSLRAVAKKLGVDPAALYRHYEDLDDLLREVGDRAIAPVTKGFVASDNPHWDIRRVLTKLRKVMLGSGAALVTASGPTRHASELQITEIMLNACQRLGMHPTESAMAYHVLIEYVVGSAVLDAPLASSKANRAATYRKWRADYAALSPEDYPVSLAHASYLYPGSDNVFQTGLDALLAHLLPPVPVDHQ
ncbi:MAG: TetR/AcrR family transcriptional regulator [Actinobacteria bacterium]|nr:TetR/AcrR family transcriptional regulator [Actinomycetota bacterium]